MLYAIFLRRLRHWQLTTCILHSISYFHREFDSCWIYKFISSERVWNSNWLFFVNKLLLSVYREVDTLVLDFTRYPVCLVCIKKKQFQNKQNYLRNKENRKEAGCNKYWENPRTSKRHVAGLVFWENPDKGRASSRMSYTHYWEDPETKRASSHAHYWEDPETKRASSHARYWEDPERKRVSSKTSSHACYWEGAGTVIVSVRW